MNVSQIIAQMRGMVKVDTSQYSDADALIDLNTVKDEFWSAILSSTNQKYNWERWTTNSVALQSEYRMPEVAYNTAWAKLLNWVAVCYKWDTYTTTGGLIYIPCREVNPDTLANDWDYYVENQDSSDPIYYVADNSYFIAPAFRNVVTNWIKLTGIRKIPDYALDTTEANMKFTVDQTNTLVFWLAVWGHRRKWDDRNIIKEAKAEWREEKADAIKMLDTRVDTVVNLSYPTETKDDLIW